METAKKPMTMAELLPGLTGIIPKDAMQTLTAKKQPRPVMQTRTTEKVLKPLTIAEMRADIQALRIKSPRTSAQPVPSAKKRNWNSSIKINKRISHTANGNMNNNPVRKVLTFQAKDKVLSNSRITINPPHIETPKFPRPSKFPRPEVKKLIHLQASNTVRISGVCHIQETPIVMNKLTKTRLTLANKENVLYNRPPKNEKKPLAPQQVSHKKILSKQNIPDTPLFNESWKSGSDASFLQKEREINDVEQKAAALANEQTLENIAEVSPPISTPFKEYRNVQEFFNNSSELETSAVYNDNTIMCFEKTSLCERKENNREESVIVSLCDLLDKAKVTTQKASTELEELLEVEQQTQYNIKMIDNAIQTLKNIKESQVKSLQYVKKLILEKNSHPKDFDRDLDKTLVADTETVKSIKVESITFDKSSILDKSCSVIKIPTYKIPKKYLCLKKNIFHKSMPNLTPDKEIDGKALNMYMKMKQQMNFLKTPVIKQHNKETLDTPAVTSHNLQRQLDRLYDES